MAVLWEIKSGTVNEVLEHLGVPLAYTTVLTVLRNLEAKQYVTRVEEGRAHRYFPRVAREAAQRSALARLVDSLFGGSPEALVAGLVEQRQLSAEELAELARSLNREGRPSRGPDPDSSPSALSPYKSESE
jgi:predicted transcriptional regulator